MRSSSVFPTKLTASFLFAENLTMGNGLKSKKSYSDIVKTAHSLCGGKSKARFCDSKELCGHLAELLANNMDDLKTFIALGKRRLRKNGKN